MSIGHSGYRVPMFVPIYLLVIGVCLVGAGIYLFAYAPEDQFVAGLSTVGGVTMVGTMLLLLTSGRRST